MARANSLNSQDEKLLYLMNLRAKHWHLTNACHVFVHLGAQSVQIPEINYAEISFMAIEC
jgi:hypothetical protein